EWQLMFFAAINLYAAQQAGEGMLAAGATLVVAPFPAGAMDAFKSAGARERATARVTPTAGTDHVPSTLIPTLAAAAFTAFRMRGYVPQRHKLPLSAASMSSSVSARPSLRRVPSSATVVMIWPV